LRDRREDIAVLANYILHEFNQRYGRQLRFSAAALETLEAYDFPGNIRELQNIVYRLAILNDEQIIEGEQVEELVLGISGNLAKERLQHRFSEVMPLQQALQQVEKELVLLAMERYRSTTRAAKALGISQSSVSRKHRQYQAEMSPYL
jgi:transcriptional regulator with PAS, ATPase and Fis domain